MRSGGEGWVASWEPTGSGDVVTSSGERESSPANPRRFRTAYFGVLLFCVVYFSRPEDWIPGLAVIPVAKMAAAIAIAAFLIGWLSIHKLVMPRELWLLLALFAQLCLAIPFSRWKGGSFDLVVMGFSKIVVMTLILIQAVNSFSRLRRLLFVHTITVATVCVVSVFIEVKTIGSYDRITGALGGIFENPNDLAASISLVFPFGIAFLAYTKNIAKKFFWLSVLAIMSFALVRTFSRGGFLSMAVGLIACAVLMGPKPRRVIAIILAFTVAAILAVEISGKYAERLVTIFDMAKDETGSSIARQALLWRSIEAAAQHPLVGIGPGQFAELSGNWHLAHNSYTELAAEAGLMASLFFTWMLVHTYRKVLRVRRQSPTPELKLFSAAIAASMAGFFVTLLFSSVEYLFYPYFLVAYGSVVAALGAGLEANDTARSAARPRSAGAGLPGELEHPTCVV